MDDLYTMLVSLHCRDAWWRQATGNPWGIHEPCVCQLQQRKCIVFPHHKPNPSQQTSQWNNSGPNLVIQSSWLKAPWSYARMANFDPQGFIRQSSCLVSWLPPTHRLNLSWGDSLSCNVLEVYENYHPITCQKVWQLSGEHMTQAKVWQTAT